MRRRRIPRLTAGPALAILVAACAGDPGAPPPAAGVGGADAPLPAAIELDEDLVMAPIGRDGRGCVQYRMRSHTRPALQAVFYRTAAGDFSTIEEEAACT